MPPNVDAAMASWAFAQAAASLAPAITQLAAANLQQQRQLQQGPKQVDPIKELSARLQESRQTESLRQALQAAMAGSSAPAPPMATLSTQPLSAQSAPSTMTMTPSQNIQLNAAQQRKIPDTKPITVAPRKATPNTTIAQPNPSTSTKRARSDEEKQAGDILLGFLSSLRQSYEEALKGKDKAETSSNENSDFRKTPSTSLHNAVKNVNQGSRPRVPQVSDISSGVSSSTGQPESSVEESDWHSDKKTETSSSEDSDKEVSGTSKGPPRKRIKTKRAADDRQREATANRKHNY